MITTALLPKQFEAATLTVPLINPAPALATIEFGQPAWLVLLFSNLSFSLEGRGLLLTQILMYGPIDRNPKFFGSGSFGRQGQLDGFWDRNPRLTLGGVGVTLSL